MYATAHHVRSRSGESGINAFLHRHDQAELWPTDVRTVALMPSESPGEPVAQALSVKPPGGNHVRSYLDVLAPEGAALPDVLNSLAEVSRAIGDDTSLPLVATRGPVVVVFGVEFALESAAHDEFERLAAAVESLLVGNMAPS